MANFALNYSFSRNLNIPLDEDAVKSTLNEVKDYVKTKSKCYAGQLFSVIGDTEDKNGLYIVLSKGENGSVIKLATQEALDAVSSSAGKIDEIQLNGNALTINNKKVNIDLTDYALISDVDSKLKNYATKSEVTDQIVSAMTGGEIELTGYATVDYVDSAITSIESELMWLPIGNGVGKTPVRHWKGSRESYELLLKNDALDNWTKYVVFDVLDNKVVYTEYYGSNQVSELTGQMLPAKSIISNIDEIIPLPYDRYLVGTDESGYNVYEYVIDSIGEHRWIIKPFKSTYGIRIKDRGLKNYVYVDGKLITYDEVDAGSF